MPNSEPTIQCSNINCAATNDGNNRFCQRCKTPLIKRYLWAIGEKSDSEPKQKTNSSKSNQQQEPQLTEEDLLVTEAFRNQLQNTPKQETTTHKLENQRYFAIKDRIYLDTKPGESPQIPEQLPREIISYLQLFAHFPSIPQVYGQLDGTEIWLLDYGSVPLDKTGKLVFTDLFPGITSLWQQATPLKQINWLRQIGALWKPLAEKEMTASLLNPELIKINGSLIQLRELEVNEDIQPTIVDLGQLWQKWSEVAHPQIQEVLIQLTQRMVSGAISTIEEVIYILDFTLELCARSQKYTSEMFAVSDSGPKRSNNQDYAYPNSEIPVQISQNNYGLTIVCDGVGGHEGGEIASRETVQYLQNRISRLSWEEFNNSSAGIFKQLAQFTNEANDLINERNDNEQRQERQRMGTTLVMSLAHNHEVFLTHVGDSRIYLITRNSCHQITTDDDLASREVRLGYAVYRDALKYPSAGALIQALGMRHSDALHPNIQRLVIDEDCILLLCTDGLSDFDRVEQYWQNVIAPIFEQKLDLKKAVNTLIKIGNERNGHDNITVALIHFQVKPQTQGANFPISWSEIETGLVNTPLLWTDENISNISFADTESYTAIVEPPPEMETSVTTPAESESHSPLHKSPFFWILMALGSIFIFSVSILIYAYIKYEEDFPQETPSSDVFVEPDSDIDQD